MSTATATAAGNNKGWGNATFAVLQRIGRSLMMPIAVLPAAGLLLRFGQADMLGKDGLGWNKIADVLASAGNSLFAALPLLFAVGIAIGFARRSDGSTGLAAVVGFLVFDAVFANLTSTTLINGKPVSMGVMGGIVMGITTALLYQRYYRIKLPPYLAFFGGRRFVPIITALAAIILAVIFAIIWPPIGRAINNGGDWIVNAGAGGAFVYGVVNRALLPFGLHHIVNTFVWFVFGNFNDPATGKVVTGEINRFLAGDPTAGGFLAGFFPIMMFALPAAAIAIAHEARPDKRKIVMGIMASAALTSFITGVTEPIEFAFLFVAPVLFGIHAVLTGVSLAVCNLLGIRDGFSFSAGLIDYLLNWGKAEKPWLLIPIGIVYAIVYYVLFRWFIRRFNLPTPGRERDEVDQTAGEREQSGPPLIDQPA